MAAELKVVALISGGKDSIFSILHCQANGHQVIALANLYPPNHFRHEPVDDLESYMYQTVGHAVIPLYEQALGLPLYRHEISGKAVSYEKSYSPHATSSASGEDETESLVPLLRLVVSQHPEVNAVSTGAILSDYQRTRVESVAIRLGLTPLSYLWQWPFMSPHTQTSLLEDMALVGQDSRIIKVASGGLNDSFLWQNVSDGATIVKLSKAAKRFGTSEDGAVLGEGGEYETLTVGGSGPLWKGRIVVLESNIKVVPGDAGSASVKITQPYVIPNSDLAVSQPLPRRPPLLEQHFLEICNVVSSQSHKLDGRPFLKAETSGPDGCLDNAMLLSGVVGTGKDVAEQTRSIMNHISHQLSMKSQAFSDVVYTTVILREMVDFTAFNSEYGSYFTMPNPPARLTIACADVLPDGNLVTISMIIASGPREGLHVQSRSYWAPANIGPYSQAIKFPAGGDSTATISGSVYIAGQIPLIPASMELPNLSAYAADEMLLQQAVLALQHLHRIGQAMKVKQWTFAIAFVAGAATCNAESERVTSTMIRRVWEVFNEPSEPEQESREETEDFDVWHLAHGMGSSPWRMQPSHDVEPDARLSRATPRLVVIAVDSLPRGACVEWVGHGKTTDTPCHSVPLHLQSLLQTFEEHILLDTSQ